MCENKGILIGVGVGPGDPELVTLKAVRMIGEADRIILPQSKAKEARAYKIALGAVPALTDKCLLGLDFPMTRAKEKTGRFGPITRRFVPIWQRERNWPF